MIVARNEHWITRHHARIIDDFPMVDVLVRMLNADHRLSGLWWVACKLVLLIRLANVVMVAAVGKVGDDRRRISASCSRTPTIKRSSRKSFRPHQSFRGRALPLGTLVDGNLTVEPLDFRFVSGDAVALTSFALPANPDDVRPLTDRLLECPRFRWRCHGSWWRRTGRRSTMRTSP